MHRSIGGPDNPAQILRVSISDIRIKASLQYSTSIDIYALPQMH